MILTGLASFVQATDGRVGWEHHTQHLGVGSRPHTPRSLTPMPPATEDGWSSESDGGVTADNIQVGH